MGIPPFLLSIRARLLLVSLLLLLIPLIGFRFIKDMEIYLREGQQQVLVSAAKLLSAMLSDRPQLLTRGTNQDMPNAATEARQDVERQRILGVFASDTPETAASLGAAYLPSEDIERILNVVSKNASRIWVVDTGARVRGLAGSLTSMNVTDKKPDFFQRIFKSVVRPLLRLLGRDNLPTMIEDASQTQQAVMSQVDRALNGEPTQLWRYLKDGRTVVLSAAQPVYVGDDIVGAVVIEETTQSNQGIATAALESLLAMSFIVFVAGFMTLIVFAWRLAYRVQRLQAEASSAIDAQGRIKGMISGSKSRDEVGALARTLEEMIQRLTRYNAYLEQMASRLAHELRTPVTVVRSSLDNLRQANSLVAASVYIERADEGVKRLCLDDLLAAIAFQQGEPKGEVKAKLRRELASLDHASSHFGCRDRLKDDLVGGAVGDERDALARLKAQNGRDLPRLLARDDRALRRGRVDEELMHQRASSSETQSPS